MRALRHHVLSTELPEEPPTEFRIFRHGVNETSKGPFIFDDAAAASVMADYRQRAVDLMVDLEHDALEENAVRADMRDARAWFALELRDGDLYAVNVRWTPDGERRLREKTQRYISPAFDDDEDGRVMRLWNVAMCAMPATYDAVPLVAASERDDTRKRRRLNLLRVIALAMRHTY